MLPFRGKTDQTRGGDFIINEAPADLALRMILMPNFIDIRNVGAISPSTLVEASHPF